MINEYFMEKFPFAYNYFSTLLELVKKNKRHFPQAIIFEGTDTKNQYLFALELARILNCKNDDQKNCDCINCKWIKSYSHPAINNVSQIHFKGDGDESKTVISVKQAKKIEQSLNLSSDYHRFFIFFSSDEKKYENDELNDFKNLGYKEIDYSIKPLEYSTFHPTTPNALLKSIEEPPLNTTFIFLTKSKENILQTIVSRCLVFKLNSKKQNLSYREIYPIICDYPKINYLKAIEISDNLQKLIKENLNTEIILNKFLEFLKELIIQNNFNTELYKKIKNDMYSINTAIKQSNANLSDKIVIDTLMLKIARGY